MARAYINTTALSVISHGSVGELVTLAGPFKRTAVIVTRFFHRLRPTHNYTRLLALLAYRYNVSAEVYYTPLGLVRERKTRLVFIGTRGLFITGFT